jgi:glycosyltransferase involved in cell wall biosynthesis
MRVALVSSDVLPTPPPRYGGLEQVVWLLARELAAMGHEVTLYALRGSRCPDGAELVELAAGEDVARRHGERLLRADIVHDHGWQRVAWSLCRDHPGLRAVWTLHGPHAGYAPPPPGLTVCGISRYHAWSIGAELGQRCPWVYNGVDLEAYPLWEGPREGYLAWMARLAPEKGLHLALAWAEEAGIPLRVAGTEHLVADAGYVQAMLRRMDGRRAAWLGDLDHARKVPFLQRARALLAPTPQFLEAFGLYLVEAMACGTPVVAMPAPSAPVELVREGGVVIHHPDDFLAALEAAMAIPPADCRRNAERFGARAMADAYVALYERVLGTSPAAQASREGSTCRGRSPSTAHAQSPNG